MNKITRGAAVAALASGSLLGAALMTAAPAQAATPRISVARSSVAMSWVTSSALSVPSYAGSVRIYPGQTAGGWHFISGWNCYSYWGHRYQAGMWHTMHTNALTLYCRNS